MAPERELGFGAFLRMVGRTPTLLCLLGAFMCANFVAVVLLSWMPKFLYDKFHMGLAMAGLNVCKVDDIAVSVLATVIGHQAEKGWTIVDAGWMAMSRDRGTAQQDGIRDTAWCAMPPAARSPTSS